MKLFRRQKSEPSIEEELKQYYTEPKEEAGRSGWASSSALRLAALGALLAIVILVVALAIGGNHSPSRHVTAPHEAHPGIHKGTSQAKTPAPSSPSGAGKGTQSSNGSVARGTSPGAGGASSHQSTATGSVSTTPQQPGKSLTNTGPGGVIGVFVVVSVVGTALSYAVILRQTADA